MDRPLYNQLVAYYELVEGRDWKREIRLIASILKVHECKSLVDLGCGTGYHARALSKLGFAVTGIDISKQNIRFAKKTAEEENVHPRFVTGSYYDYSPYESFDAALCLNWSIPVRSGEVKRFLDNTYSLLRPRGLLIFDFERISEIVWSDVGKAFTASWDLEREVVVRASVGQMASNVLYSKDVYIIYSKASEPTHPDERSRYQAAGRNAHVQIFVDRSCVRFFSMKEIRDFAQRSKFRLLANRKLPRNKYRRNYAVLEKVN
jgi:SAM-dependent methyltransferase